MNRILYVIVFIFIYGSFWSQTENRDAQLWGYFKLEKKLTERVGFFLSLKGRATNNMMVPGRGAVDLGFSYKFSKNIRGHLDYQFVERLKNSGSYRPMHQLRASIALKGDVGHWSFIYRNMLQIRSKGLMDDHDNHILYFYDRNKLTIKYELTKRFSLYAAEEVYIPLNNPQLKGPSRSRSYAGTLILITKRQQLDLFFMYQLQLKQGDWYNDDTSYPFNAMAQKFVYGIGYTIEF
jgi:hypothetical protein